VAGVAKIELPESWADVTDPLRALTAEVERQAHAHSATRPDLATVSAGWARVSDAIRATVRAWIACAGCASAGIEAIAHRQP
jgi:hypothetical protein